MKIEFADRVVELSAGQCFVVTRGVRHKPVAEEECWIALIEPVATKHTRDVVREKTRSIDGSWVT
jgi:mannose-6-phosphate isomerase-like protein (cupin superfamily)